nr:MAG TPA: ATP synthase B chain precursor-like protein [Caudoviricetes sp.]
MKVVLKKFNPEFFIFKNFIIRVTINFVALIFLFKVIILGKNFIELLLKDYKTLEETKRQLKEDYTFMAQQIIDLERKLRTEIRYQQAEINHLKFVIDDLKIQLYNKGNN